jgi:hypothetical protein
MRDDLSPLVESLRHEARLARTLAPAEAGDGAADTVMRLYLATLLDHGRSHEMTDPVRDYCVRVLKGTKPSPG